LVSERRRHDEVFARHVDVQLLHQRDVFDVFRGNERDRDVAHVELVLLDQVEQEVERPLERRKLDTVPSGVRRLHHGRARGGGRLANRIAGTRLRPAVLRGVRPGVRITGEGGVAHGARSV
jgi:hypothetical protein